MSRRKKNKLVQAYVPHTEFLGNFHTKYAAQAFVQGICFVLRNSGVDPPTFGILPTNDKALFGMRTLWQVWKSNQ